MLSAPLIQGRHLPSRIKRRVQVTITLSALASGSDDIDPSNLQRLIQILSDRKSIDHRSGDHDRSQKSESFEAEEKQRIFQELERIDKSMQLSNSARPPDAQQNSTADSDLPGIEIMKDGDGPASSPRAENNELSDQKSIYHRSSDHGSSQKFKNDAEDIQKIFQELERIDKSMQLSNSIRPPEANQNSTTDSDLPGIEIMEDEDGSASSPRAVNEESGTITDLGDAGYADKYEEVVSNKQPMMKLFNFFGLDGDSDSQLCPQCNSPSDEDDLKDFGKCVFCRQKDLRDPRVHKIQHSDGSFYSNDMKSTTRSNTALSVPDQRLSIDKQRKERQERLTSPPNDANESKSQTPATLSLSKSSTPLKAEDIEKAISLERRLEETMDSFTESTTESLIYNGKFEFLFDEEQGVQQRDSGLEARGDIEEDPNSNPVEEFQESDDDNFSERLEAMEVAFENLELYAYRDIDNIKRDLSQVMSVRFNTRGLDAP